MNNFTIIYRILPPEWPTKNGASFNGVETRSSSPVTIIRNEDLESSISGIYPCGEGPGYAGGITSAAIAGIKVTKKIIGK